MKSPERATRVEYIGALGQTEKTTKGLAYKSKHEYRCLAYKSEHGYTNP